MINTGKLAGKTVFVSGASRGIGKAIALKVAKDGANVVIAAKTAAPHPKLPGTIYTAAEEIEAVGGKAFPCIMDVRNDEQVKSAVAAAVEKFGGIDILVNNASAIYLTGTLETDMKKYDLMHGIIARGPFLLSKTCIPHLKNSKNPHILNITPPLNIQHHWFEKHLAYTLAKYCDSMSVYGMSGEFKTDGIAVNGLWPYTMIATSAIKMLSGEEGAKFSRKPDIMADAAYSIFVRDAKSCTGNFFIDEEVVKSEGITDLKQYAVDPSNVDNLALDFFTDAKFEDVVKTAVAKSVYEKLQSNKQNSGSAGGISKIFDLIKSKLSSSVVENTQLVYLFRVNGTEAGTWYIDLKNGSGCAGAGEPASPPDVTFTMDTKDLYAIFDGKLNTANAFLTGKVKIDGALYKASRLEPILEQLKQQGTAPAHKL